MRIKQEFQPDDIAHLSNGKRFNGFQLKSEAPVKIVKAHKIDNKAGGWMYDIEVRHPKTGETLIFEGWVTQFELFSKASWSRFEALRRLAIEAQQKIAGKIKSL